MSGRRAVSLLQWAVLVVGATAVAVLVTTSRGAEAETLPQADLLKRGGPVYAQNCTACHGSDGGGRPGTGVRAGPPVNDVDVAYVDQLVRTGRMPIHAVDLGVVNEQLGDRDREALVAWMADRFDLPGEIPEVGPGDVGRGHELYATNCAQCHGATGTGGIAADGTRVLPVHRVDRVAIVEAIRVGPFQMPAFEEDVLSDRDVDDIAAFIVDEMSSATPTPLFLSEINRVTMTALAAVLVLAVVGGVLLIARPVRLPQEHREVQERAQEESGG